jgi:hypothetical protein
LIVGNDKFSLVIIFNTHDGSKLQGLEDVFDFFIIIIIEIFITIWKSLCLLAIQESLSSFNEFVEEELTFLELELGLDKLGVKLLGSIFSVLDLGFDVPCDIKWSKSIIVKSFVSVVLELNEL